MSPIGFRMTVMARAAGRFVRVQVAINSASTLCNPIVGVTAIKEPIATPPAMRFGRSFASSIFLNLSTKRLLKNPATEPMSISSLGPLFSGRGANL